MSRNVCRRYCGWVTTGTANDVSSVQLDRLCLGLCDGLAVWLLPDVLQCCVDVMLVSRLRDAFACLQSSIGCMDCSTALAQGPSLLAVMAVCSSSLLVVISDRHLSLLRPRCPPARALRASVPAAASLQLHVPGAAGISGSLVLVAAPLCTSHQLDGSVHLHLAAAWIAECDLVAKCDLTGLTGG
jgi:hypothetical protein